MEGVYSQAREALESGEEDKARDLLFRRTQIEEKLKKSLINCADEKKRLVQMQENVRAIEERAIEMESLMKRSIGAKVLQDSSSLDGDVSFSLSQEDPLLQKFRDAG